MFIKMSGQGSSELITELFICSFVSPVVQTVLKIRFLMKVCYYSLKKGAVNEACTVTLLAFWSVNVKYESFTRTLYAY